MVLLQTGPFALAGGTKSTVGSERTQRREFEQQREIPRSAPTEARESPKSDAERPRETNSQVERETERSVGRVGEQEKSERGAQSGLSRYDFNEAARTRHNDDPPGTVAEALSRLFKSNKAAAPDVTKSGQAPVNFSANAPVIGNKAHSNRELLALNLSKSATERARKLGFSIHPGSSLVHLNSAVARLIPPPGMDAVQARGLLQSNLPAEQFALNRIYRLYRPANSSNAHPAQRTAPAGRSADACKEDHCAGRSSIQWKSSLQACSKGLRVGVIDTDVDHQHPTFASVRLHVGHFAPEGSLPAPNWHGTGVLALLAGSPRSGTPGLIADSEFYVANVFFADATGDFATDTVSVLKALDWLSAFDAKVINMSFSGPRDELVQKAIASMSARGVVFVAAAGNGGPTAGPSYPAAYKEVVAVTAISKEQKHYPYASRGRHIDVAAPGVDIWTAVPSAQEGYHSGTSFAAPYVTAILATALKTATNRQKDHLLNAANIVDLGPPGRDPIYGRGLLLASENCASPAASSSVAQTHENNKAQPSSTGTLPAVNKNSVISSSFK